jgi:hypothetical protein
MAHRVDAAVDDMQAPGGHAVVDRAGAEAEVPQLGPGDHAMLDAREVCDLPPRGRRCRRPSPGDYTF